MPVLVQHFIPRKGIQTRVTEFHIFKSETADVLTMHMYVCMHVCMHICMYVCIRVGHKADPCTSTFNDLSCFNLAHNEYIL
jgi:hypothetical protein